MEAPCQENCFPPVREMVPNNDMPQLEGSFPDAGGGGPEPSPETKAFMAANYVAKNSVDQTFASPTYVTAKIANAQEATLQQASLMFLSEQEADLLYVKKGDPTDAVNADQVNDMIDAKGFATSAQIAQAYASKDYSSQTFMPLAGGVNATDGLQVPDGPDDLNDNTVPNVKWVNRRIASFNYLQASALAPYATIASLQNYATLNGPVTFNQPVTVPTPPDVDDDGSAANTAWVRSRLAELGASFGTAVSGTYLAKDDAAETYAPLAGGFAFGDAVSVPDLPDAENSLKLAPTGWVRRLINSMGFLKASDAATAYLSKNEALQGYVPVAGGVDLGATLTAPAPAGNDNSTKLVNSSWVRNFIASLGYLTDADAGLKYLDTADADARYLQLTGGNVTGDLSVQTPASGDSSHLAANTSWVRAFVNSLGFLTQGAADARYAQEVELGNYVPTAGNVTLGHTISSPNPAADDNSGTLATTAWVRAFVATLGYLTTDALNTALAAYVKATDLSSALVGYVTQSALNTALSAYSKTADIATTLQGYATTQAMNSAIGSALQSYARLSDITDFVTNGALTTALGAYAKAADLASYMTTSAFNSAISAYAKSADLGAYLTTTAFNSAIAAYAKTSDLAGYVTNSALATTLSGYAKLTDISNFVTSSTLTATLATYAKLSDISNFVTTNALNTALSAYTTSTALTTQLGNYLLKTGGTITGSLTVNGQITSDRRGIFNGRSPYDSANLPYDTVFASSNYALLPVNATVLAGCFARKFSIPGDFSSVSFRANQAPTAQTDINIVGLRGGKVRFIPGSKAGTYIPATGADTTTPITINQGDQFALQTPTGLVNVDATLQGVSVAFKGTIAE
jgi:hypothetical protein